MTRAVFFDLGKVLLDFDWGAVCKSATTWCDAEPARMTRWIATSRQIQDYECGRLTSHQFFEHARIVKAGPAPLQLRTSMAASSRAHLARNT